MLILTDTTQHNLRCPNQRNLNRKTCYKWKDWKERGEFVINLDDTLIDNSRVKRFYKQLK